MSESSHNKISERANELCDAIALGALVLLASFAPEKVKGIAVEQIFRSLNNND